MSAMETATRHGRVELECPSPKVAMGMRMKAYKVLARMRRIAEKDEDVRQIVESWGDIMFTLEGSNVVLQRREDAVDFTRLRAAIEQAGGEVKDYNAQAMEESMARVMARLNGGGQPSESGPVAIPEPAGLDKSKVKRYY